jgi:hypothetical protein
VHRPAPADDWPAVGIAVLIDGDGRAHRARRGHRPPTRLGAEISESDDPAREEAAGRPLEERSRRSCTAPAAYKKQLVRVYLQTATLHEARRRNP